MIITKWKPATGTGTIPPLGPELRNHLQQYDGRMKELSCLTWELLYKTMEENGIQLADVSFTSSGKPYFAGGGYYFSLSHNIEVCAVSLSDRPVGVDIERVQDYHDDRLIERSLSPDEKAYYNGDFVRLWCRKEAVAKLTGEGFIGYPNQINTYDNKYNYSEQQIDFNNNKYWLVTVTC